MKATRLLSIDIAKAICIILVVIGHYAPDNSPHWYLVLNNVIYAFHMPLFLFASGYVYWATRKPVKYKDFVWKKFQRLMIPYFFVSVLIIAIKLETEKGLSVENPVSVAAFYQMFWLPVAGYFLWFVFDLFWCFLIVPFFNTRKKLMLLLGFSLLLYLAPIELPLLFCLGQLKYHLLWFVLGCCLVEWTVIRTFVRKIPTLVVLSFFVGMFILKQYTPDTAIWGIVLSLILALSGIVFISGFSKGIEQKMKRTKSVFLYIAACSYTIYLFHTTFEGFAKALVIKFIPSSMIDSNWIFILIVGIVVLTGIIAPIIIHQLTVRYSKLFSFLIGCKFTGR